MVVTSLSSISPICSSQQLDVLSDELLVKIFSNVSHASLVSLRAVNRRCYSVVRDQTFWKVVTDAITPFANTASSQASNGSLGETAALPKGRQLSADEIERFRGILQSRCAFYPDKITGETHKVTFDEGVSCWILQPFVPIPPKLLEETFITLSKQETRASEVVERFLLLPPQDKVLIGRCVFSLYHLAYRRPDAIPKILAHLPTAERISILTTNVYNSRTSRSYIRFLLGAEYDKRMGEAPVISTICDFATFLPTQEARQIFFWHDEFGGGVPFHPRPTVIKKMLELTTSSQEEKDRLIIAKKLCSIAARMCFANFITLLEECSPDKRQLALTASTFYSFEGHSSAMTTIATCKVNQIQEVFRLIDNPKTRRDLAFRAIPRAIIHANVETVREFFKRCDTEGLKEIVGLPSGSSRTLVYDFIREAKDLAIAQEIKQLFTQEELDAILREKVLAGDGYKYEILSIVVSLITHSQPPDRQMLQRLLDLISHQELVRALSVENRGKTPLVEIVTHPECFWAAFMIMGRLTEDEALCALKVRGIFALALSIDHFTKQLNRLCQLVSHEELVCDIHALDHRGQNLLDKAKLPGKEQYHAKLLEITENKNRDVTGRFVTLTITS